MAEGSEPKVSGINLEDVAAIVQGIVKARKILNMYPSNNPIYIKTFNEIFSRIKSFLDVHNELLLKINQNDIIYTDEQVYSATQKEDNLALFFFRDGIRELTFLKGLGEDEFSDFIKIINTDFENITGDDDIVTLLWERDFEHIRYLVTEEFLYDKEDEIVYEKAKDKMQTNDNLTRAYQDGLQAPEENFITPIPISDADYQHLLEDVKTAEAAPRIDKLITILYELLFLTKEEKHFSEVAEHLKELMLYCVKEGDFHRSSSIFRVIKNFTDDKSIEERNRKILANVYRTLNSSSLMKELSRVLDSEKTIDEGEFLDFIKNFDKTSIPAFIQLLGELQHIKSRRLMVEALTIVGKLDIKKLGEGLNDSRWYVTRNVVTVLGKIADSWSAELLTKALKHSDERVRKETIKALSGIGGSDILPHLKPALNDSTPSIRTAAGRAISSIKTDPAKKILLQELSKKDFSRREFSEKKEFYSAISQFKDSEVKNHLLNTLKKGKFFKRSKHDETRACAAYALGMTGVKEAIPLLEKTKKSNNKFLKTCSVTALNQLKKQDD